MASNFTVPTGYDCNWVEDPPEELKCLICLCVAREPRQHPGEDTNECGKIFCEACLDKLSVKECPNCRGPLKVFKDTSNSRRIKALAVKCDHLEAGCSWNGELSSLEDHLKENCDFAILPCPNKCQDNNKVNHYPRKEMQQHFEECPRRMYTCPLCGEEGEYRERVETHLDTCPKLKVECPNDSCPATIPRCEVTDHRKSCDFECVPCKYETLGCTEMPPRKKLKAHEEDVQLHFNITAKQVLELTKTVAQLQERAQSKLVPFKFELNSFCEQQEVNKIFYSGPFYTSLNGYKMRIRIDPGGNGKGVGTHVSVFACLMRGVNDDNLDWPFLATVEFTLLNQLEDKNHSQRSVTFSGDDKYNGKVIEEEGGTSGWGFSKFISHADLAYNSIINCQYLKDDKLIFRIDVSMK